MSNKTQLILYSSAMVLIVALAYKGLIPTKLHDIPNYDSLGHFVLYGLWGYFFGKVFHAAVLSGKRFYLPVGIVIAVIIVVPRDR